ncbi:MAG TPA: DUF4058 family protein [Anaerolineae bacterium]|nr:DUF4058 family protein [Anaerolineae bacterium]
MSPPFPGMDPYLEGYLWPDVHARLVGQISRQLIPLLAPRYVVRLAVYFVGDRIPAHEIGVMFPDVEEVRPRGPTSPLAATDVAMAQLTISPLP